MASSASIHGMLPPPPASAGSARLLALGLQAGTIARLGAAGYAVATHALDLAPAAVPVGRPFAPPVTTWPYPDAAFDAVLLFDELAFVVDDEAAIAEAARVLRPGGTFLLRVPNAGPLAWLDGFNLYRYLRVVTRHGPRLRETRGLGWRRHYRRREVEELLAGRFHVRSVQGRGVGVAEAVRFALLLTLRWALPLPGSVPDLLATRIPAAVERAEANLRLGGAGAHLLIAAERRPAAAVKPGPDQPPPERSPAAAAP